MDAIVRRETPAMPDEVCLAPGLLANYADGALRVMDADCALTLQGETLMRFLAFVESLKRPRLVASSPRSQ